MFMTMADIFEKDDVQDSSSFSGYAANYFDHGAQALLPSEPLGTLVGTVCTVRYLVDIV